MITFAKLAELRKDMANSIALTGDPVFVVSPDTAHHLFDTIETLYAVAKAAEEYLKSTGHNYIDGVGKELQDALAALKEDSL